MSPSAALRRSTQLVKSGKSDEAKNSLALALKDSPESRVAIRLGVLEGNAARFEEAMKMDSSNRAARFFSAMASIREGDFQKALAAVSEGLKVSPSNLSLIALGKVAECRLSGAVGPLASSINILSATTMEVQAMALATAEEMILKFDPADKGAEAREVLMGGPAGWLFEKLDDGAVIINFCVSYSLNILRNIGDSRKREASAHVIKADALYAMGQDEAAFNNYKKALKEEPGNSQALESLSAYCVLKGKWKEAANYIREFQKLEEAKAVEPIITRWKGDIAFCEGNADDAEKHYAAAADSFRMDYMIPYRQGLLRLKAKDAAGAEKHFAQALSRINPGLLAERIEKLKAISAAKI